MTGETSRDYAHPYRPWPVRALNGLPWAAPSLAPHALIAAARRAEGLTDFGDPDPRPLLARLIPHIQAEAQLSVAGAWITRIRLIDLLRNRLRLQQLLAQNPSIREDPLLPPVIVVGLQRTGTTLLHRLLAAAPGARSVRSWEALNPVPFQRGADPDARIRHAERATRGLAWLAPDFFAVHPIDPHAPEEEVVLLELSLYSTVSEATLNVPSWSSWLEEQDQTPGYQLLRTTLQALQRQSGGSHWVLKTPHHLEWLPTLLEVFPQARLVMTHRDPVQTLASFCSMVAHGRGLTSDRVDPRAIGAEWERKCHRMLTRALAARDAHPEVPVLDVQYADLLADPVGQVERIHRFAGLPWADLERGAVRAELDKSPQHRFGKHTYAASDFGLSDSRIAETFADYRSRFATIAQ